MYPRVLREVARVGEGLVALRAFVRLRLPHVDLRVHLQVRLRTEDLERRGERRDEDYSTCYNSALPRHRRPSRQKLLGGGEDRPHIAGRETDWRAWAVVRISFSAQNDSNRRRRYKNTDREETLPCTKIPLITGQSPSLVVVHINADR